MGESLRQWGKDGSVQYTMRPLLAALPTSLLTRTWVNMYMYTVPYRALPSCYYGMGVAWHGMAWQRHGPWAGLAWLAGPHPGRFIHSRSKEKVGWAALARMAGTVHHDGAKPALLCVRAVSSHHSRQSASHLLLHAVSIVEPLTPRRRL